MNIRTIGIAYFLILLAALAANAEEVTFPEVKEGKVLEDNWYHLFAEGKKVGYRHSRFVEVECDGKPCLLIDGRNFGQTKVGGKTLRYEGTERMIVGREDIKPMHYTESVSTPGLKSSVTARVVEAKDGWTLKVSKSLNGKTASEAKTFPSDVPVYFNATANLLYRNQYFKEKKDVTINVFDFTKVSIDQKGFAYKGEKTQGEGKDASTFHLVKYDFITTWYHTDGSIGKLIWADGQFSAISTDEKGAKDFSARWESYKAPDYIEGDVMTAKALGIKITRPTKASCFLPFFEQNGFAIVDPFGEVELAAIVLHGVPKGTKHDEALKKIREIYKDDELGNGDIVNAGKDKCLRGSLKMGTGIDADSGEYYLFIHNNRVLFIMAAGKGNTYKNVRDAIIKCVNSIEFFKPEFDEGKLLFTDKKTGLQFKLPNAGWTVLPVEGAQGISTQMAHPWTKSAGFVQKLPANPNLTPEILIAHISRTSKALASGTMKVAGYKTGWIDVEVSQDGQTLIRKHVFIFREKDLVSFGLIATKENWEAMKPHFEAVVKSLKFVEKDKEKD